MADDGRRVLGITRTPAPTLMVKYRCPKCGELVDIDAYGGPPMHRHYNVKINDKGDEVRVCSEYLLEPQWLVNPQGFYPANDPRGMPRVRQQ